MGTTRTLRERTDNEPMQSADIQNASLATDWRRMTAAAHDKIADRAHQLYEERGRESGHDVEDWLKAEHEIEERHSSECE